MVTDEMVEKACLAYWGEKNMTSMFARKTREGVMQSMRTALEAALSKDAEPVKWQWRSRVKGGAWDAWENGRYGQEVPPFMEVEARHIAEPVKTAPAVAEEIADAVLAWMVKYDLLEAGNEYQAADVLAVLDDLKPSYQTESAAPAVAVKALDDAACLFETLAEGKPDDDVDAIMMRVMAERARSALSAQVQDVGIPEGFELYGHWSKHRLSDGCFLPLPCYVPEGPDYTTIALYRASPASKHGDAE